LVHVLPDTNETYMEWADKNGYKETFPLPTFMCMIGYVFILLIDRVIAASFKINENASDHDVKPEHKKVVPEPVEMTEDNVVENKVE
jgi:hypothetical protein